MLGLYISTNILDEIKLALKNFLLLMMATSEAFRLVLYLTLLKVCFSEVETSKEGCPLWHVRDVNGECICGASMNSHVSCDSTYVYVHYGDCMTWNNSTNEVVFHKCFFTSFILDINSTGLGCSRPGTYRIPNTLTGIELNKEICKGYNRMGTRCEQCLPGYGPAVFSEKYACADCSSYKNYWIFRLVFQLFMITLMYLLFIPLQINVASSPFNVLLTYIQIASAAFEIPISVHSTLECYFGKTFTDILITVAGFFNLNFFRLFLKPSCISTSIKAIDTLLFNYIVVIYPPLLTAVFFVCIRLHDRRNKLFMIISYPLTKVFKLIHKSWNPKRTILRTFVTFFVLSYTKTLIASLKFLVASQLFNKHGQFIPNSKVLFYDTTIVYFGKEHIPYACIAIGVLLIFVICPTLFIALYPTCLCRKMWSWNIISHLMDIFQGQFKNGTEGTTDYRFLSATSFVLRILVGFEIIVLNTLSHKLGIKDLLVPGLVQISIGTMYFITKPYKKAWLSHLDGAIFTSVGLGFVMLIYGKLSIYAAVVGVGLFAVIILIFFVYAVYKCIRGCIHARVDN